MLAEIIFLAVDHKLNQMIDLFGIETREPGLSKPAPKCMRNGRGHRHLKVTMVSIDSGMSPSHPKPPNWGEFEAAQNYFVNQHKLESILSSKFSLDSLDLLELVVELFI